MKALLLLLVLALPARASTIWLNWNPSTSFGVDRYKVYVGPTSGKYNKVYSVESCCQWSTNLPNMTATNFFVVAAMGTNGIESAPSNEAFWKTTATNVPPTNPPTPILVILDNTNAGFAGTWSVSTKGGGSVYGPNYADDQNSGKGTKRAYWVPKLIPGKYEVAVRHPTPKAGMTLCLSVPYTVVSATSTNTINVNQTSGDGSWKALGTWSFTGAAKESVTVTNKNAGFVIIDAVRFTPK